MRHLSAPSKCPQNRVIDKLHWANSQLWSFWDENCWEG
jgi:hypothetical protein